MNVSRNFLILGVLTVASMTLCRAGSAVRSGLGAHHHPVAIGIVCDDTTPTASRQLHDWDGRFSNGRSGKVCVDSGRLLKFVPERVGTRYDRITEYRVLILQMAEADAKRLAKLTTLEPGEVRQQAFMLDGSVVMMAPIGGAFSGTILTLDPSSDEEAMGLAALISI